MVMVIWSGASPAWAAPAATDTSLTIASGGNTLTSGESLASGSVVTLTATVMAGTTPVIVGQVNFCDASATYCTDIHLLGAAQLTSAGTAVYKFRPGVGSHSYKAVFVGTPNGALACAGSTSSTVTLTTTAIGWPTNTTIANSGGATNPILTATVSGAAGAALSGTVSFLDSSNGNALLGTATLAAVSASLNFMNISNPAAGIFPYQVVSADFNGDGIPDLAVLDACSPNPDCGAKNGVVTTLLGNGNGTFTATATTPAGGYDPYGIVVGDFNGDGIPDLAVVNDGSSAGGTVTVLLGNGDGTFTPTTTSPVTVAPAKSVAVADFTGDGVSDLAVANVAESDGTYEGTVAVLLAENQMATATVTPVNVLTAGSGTHQAVASYLGNTDFDASTSLPTVLTAEPGTPTVTLTPSANTATYGTSVTLTATVTGKGLTPTGTVTFYDGVAALRLVALNGSGVAACSTTTLAVGAHSISASYSGDANYNPVTSSAVVLTVSAPLTPTVTVTPSSTGITTLQSLTVAVAVSGGSANPTPTGSVNLTGGGYTSAVMTLLSGGATIGIPAGSLAAGSDTLTVTYTPDSSSASTFLTATQSATVTVSTPIGAAIPAVTVTPSATTITDEQSLVVTVAVAGGSGQPKPTGTVTLSSGAYSAHQPLSGGIASLTIPAGTLSSGANTLTATYAGDETYGSASGTTTVTGSPFVIAIPVPSSVAPGSSATVTATLTTGSTFSGTMDLTCTLTAFPTDAPSLPTCSLNPASVTIATGGSGTTTFTVKTTAASSSAVLRPSRLNLQGLGGAGAALAGLLMLGIPSRRRRWTSMLFLLWIVVATGAIGCSSVNTLPGLNNPTPDAPGTTAGGYTFTVTGSDSTNALISASTNVTVTVQ